MPRILNSALACPTADYTEQRDGKVLLIWKDVPHWMVVDEDFRAFLAELDGARTLADVARRRPSWDAAQRDIKRAARTLFTAGVLRDAKAKPVAHVPSPAPIENIAVNMTKRCNLRCRFCYYLPHLVTDAPNELGAEEIIAVLEAARPSTGRKPSLVLLGGEPLLEPEKVLAVATHAARRRFACVLSTNGTLVTDDFAKRARAARLQVQVSLDGHTAKLNDAVRGRGVFEKAVRGIRTLTAHKVHTIASLVCHAGNAPFLAEFYALAHSLGANEARFIPLKRIGGGRAGECAPVSMRELVAKAGALFAAHPEFLRMAGRDCFSILATTCSYSARKQSCGTGLQTFLLDADGSLYPCLNTNAPELRIANVRAPGFDFARTWKEAAVLAKVRACTATAALKGPCADCAVRAWCLGGCRGEALAAYGELGREAPNCADLKAAILEMFWMLAERPGLIGRATSFC
jgi:mycofactocin biosynthetic radical S-adenosylmethionine protein MftC